MAAYGLPDLVRDLRRITTETTDEKEILKRVKPLAESLAADPGWVRPEYLECDPEQGFGVHLLHEESDHSNAVFAIAWLPGRGLGPHNHRTWAVVAGICGEECETVWSRLDDGGEPGRAVLEAAGEATLAAGGVCCLDSEAIHSVRNDGETVAMSLHIYGKHINHTGRSRFDPAKMTEEKLVLSVD